MSPSSSLRAVTTHVLATPVLILPLALTTVNAGVAWIVAASVRATIGLPDAVVPIAASILDVCGSLALIFIVAMLLKSALMGVSDTCSEVWTHAPAFAAGLMAVWSLASWWEARGASHFAVVLWGLTLIAFMALQLMFVCKIVGLARLAYPERRFLATLYAKMEPPWIVPLVGITAATATGSRTLGWFIHVVSGPQAALDGLRYTPVTLGTFWAILIVPPMWIKAVRTGTLWRNPPCAILAASAGIVLAGWMGATGPITVGLPSDLRSSAFTHILALLVFVTGLPIVALAPRYLWSPVPCCATRAPFDPKVSTVGFPLEICAIGMLQYAVVAEDVSGVGSAHARAACIVAWLLLVACTLAAATILAQYAEALLQALHRALAERDAVLTDIQPQFGLQESSMSAATVPTLDES